MRRGMVVVNLIVLLEGKRITTGKKDSQVLSYFFRISKWKFRRS